MAVLDACISIWHLLMGCLNACTSNTCLERGCPHLLHVLCLQEITNFQLDVNPSGLRGALERFAQFFIAPLIKPDALEREVNAVDNEFSGEGNIFCRGLWHACDSIARMHKTSCLHTFQASSGRPAFSLCCGIPVAADSSVLERTSIVLQNSCCLCIEWCQTTLHNLDTRRRAIRALL